MRKTPFVLAPAALVTLALAFPMNFLPGNGKSIPQTSQINSASLIAKVEQKADSRRQIKTEIIKQPAANSGIKPSALGQSDAGVKPEASVSGKPDSVKAIPTGFGDKTPKVALGSETGKAVSNLKPPVGHTKEIVGYYAEDWPGDTASLISVKSYGNKLSGVATFSSRLNRNGSLTGGSPSSAIKAAHRTGSKALLLVHNYNNGKFDGDLVHAIVTDPLLRKKTAENILSVVKQANFDGVNIDLENIRSGDRVMFTRFIKELTELLHSKGYMVTISVPAKTSDSSGGWGGAFDYGELGKLADRIMLMTYDEHWFGGNPGPVASLGWVEQVIRYAKSRIPAGKVLLGLGVYGYEWDVNSGSSTRALPAAKALQVAYQYKADIKWDNTAQTPYFYYWPGGKKHVVWFESNNSAAFKMQLVNKYNLAGVAIWRLGFEDAGFWQLVSQKFGTVN